MALFADYYQYPLVFKKPIGTSRGYLHVQQNFFVRLAWSEEPACFGLGECGPLTGLSLDDRPDFEARLAEVCAAINRGYPPGELDLTDWPSLAFGLETAWLDLQGGGQRRLFDTPFSRGEAVIPIHGLIWMADFDGLLGQMRARIEQGFRCLKLKVGALDFETECVLLAAIRADYPPEMIEIRVDANGAFSPTDAPGKLARLAEYGLHSIEQPLKPGQPARLAELCAASPLPIALDEELIGFKDRAAKQSFLEQIRPQALVLKPTLLGGLAAAEEWIELAQALGIDWWVNSALESNIGLNAIAQWISARQPDRVQGLGTGQLYTNNLPGPIRLDGAGLRYDTTLRWDFSPIFAKSLSENLPKPARSLRPGRFSDRF